MCILPAKIGTERELERLLDCRTRWFGAARKTYDQNLRQLFMSLTDQMFFDRNALASASSGLSASAWLTNVSSF